MEKQNMNNQNFTTTITVDQTPQAVFAAINNVRGWWAGEIEGNTDKLGEEFVYRYGTLHYSKQKVSELTPGKRVVWDVTDSSLDFTKDKSEWTGTKITFDIGKKDGKTEVRFTHVGLAPKMECYSDCSNAWGSLVRESLHSLITAGVG